MSGGHANVSLWRLADLVESLILPSHHACKPLVYGATNMPIRAGRSSWEHIIKWTFNFNPDHGQMAPQSEDQNSISHLLATAVSFIIILRLARLLRDLLLNHKH